MDFKIMLYSLLFSSFFLLFGCNSSDKRQEVAAILNTTNTPKQQSQETQQPNSVTEDKSIQEIVQKSIDLPNFQQYYHIDDLPERSPLIILKSELTSSLELNKFGEKVEIWDKPSIDEGNKAHLVFSKIEIDGNSGSVNFSYPIEGVGVEIKFSKNDSEWIIKESRIIEN